MSTRAAPERELVEFERSPNAASGPVSRVSLALGSIRVGPVIHLAGGRLASDLSGGKILRNNPPPTKLAPRSERPQLPSDGGAKVHR